MILSEHRTIFSVAADYFPAAAAELQRAIPGARIARIGPDAGRIITTDVGIAEVATICRDQPVVFVRHLMREEHDLPVETIGHDLRLIVDLTVRLMEVNGGGREIALQTWTSGSSTQGMRPDDVWRSLAASLRDRGFSVARANCPWIVSLLMTSSRLHLGLNRQEDALADWPGGRVSLAKQPEQISRSEFKLEELFKLFDMPLQPGGVALDLGASPGGWTRLLRRAGHMVWAVDPADLDSRLLADPAVHHIQTTAGAFLRQHDQTYDLVVNDIRMEPARSCQLMVDAARHLGNRGTAIVTLKLEQYDPLSQVEASLRTLARAYDILFARQLFHNRHEVTVVARRRGA